jgi:F0F1-type ATP synthase assembly protein I
VSSKPGDKQENDKQQSEFFRLMARYSPVIMLMPASALAGYAIGYGFDYLFSTTFLRFVFLILGVVSGIVQLIRILGRDA